MIERLHDTIMPWSQPDAMSIQKSDFLNEKVDYRGVTLSFSSLLQNVVNDMSDRIRQAENLSFAAIQGKATTREVVDAVMQSERILQTAVAFRDKIISAYLEITRMQI